MNDQFTEVTTKSWGSRIIGSIKGILVGFLMFIISFVILYWNEGRVDLSKMAEDAVEISATSQAPEEVNQKLVYVFGDITSEEVLGDTYLKQGKYLSLIRRVEMFAWEESKQSDSERNVGGSETTKTTYSYTTDWTANPEDSSRFKVPEGHTNPQMTLNERTMHVNNASLGVYTIRIGSLSLPPHHSVALSNENVIPSDGLTRANSQYLFKGNGTITNPQIGDIRVSYSAIDNPLKSVTLFGKLNSPNKQIEPYVGKKNSRLYRVFEGDRAMAISTLSTEHSVMTWILRLVGFLLMWIGLMMLFGPISVFLDVLPVFGSIGRIGIGLITLVVAIAFSVVTILVSMVFHNIIALALAILALVVGGVVYLKTKRKKQVSPMQTRM